MRVGSNNPKRELRRQELARLKAQRKLDRAMRSEIQKANDQFIDSFESMDSTLFFEAIQNEHLQGVSEILDRSWSEVIRIAQKKVENDINKVSKDDLFQEIVDEFIVEHGAAKVKIADTTKERIKFLVKKQQELGISTAQIAQEMRKLSPQISRARAAKIARTEAGMAYSKGSQAAAEASGVELQKEWVSGPNENARETHQDLNGTVVELNEAFNVDGEMMMYPRDSNGSPENIINCRCAVVYRTKDS